STVDHPAQAAFVAIATTEAFGQDASRDGQLAEFVRVQLRHDVVNVHVDVGVDRNTDAAVAPAHATPAFALSAATRCSASAMPRALRVTVVGNCGSSSVTKPASSKRLTVRRVYAWYCTGPLWR